MNHEILLRIMRYLGIYFDSVLTWEKHADHTNKKLHRGIGILRKIRTFVQERTLKHIFNAFIKPYIEYATPIWRGGSKTNLLKTDRTINKIICTMLFNNKFEPVKPIYIYLNILAINNKIKLMQGKFMLKLINKEHPISIQSKFPLNFNMTINSNDNMKLYMPFCRTNIAKRSLHYQGFKSWNYKIPTKLKNSIRDAKPLIKITKHLYTSI